MFLSKLYDDDDDDDDDDDIHVGIHHATRCASTWHGGLYSV